MKRKHKITISVIIICLVVLVGGFFVWRWQTREPATQVMQSHWEKYENKNIGYSFLYPKGFKVNKRSYPKENAFSTIIENPKTGRSFAYIRSYGRESDIDDVRDYFTGPYPREIAPHGNLPGQTVDTYTFNGMKGIELYGKGAEGRGYSDTFMYLHRGRLWAISLDPVLRGHATPEDLEPGFFKPTEDYQKNYRFVMTSISIWDIVEPIDEKAALKSLQNDVAGVSSHFVKSEKSVGQELSVKDEKIKKDIARLLSAKISVLNPENPPTSPEHLLQFGFFLRAVSERYILIARAGADSTYDQILDVQTGDLTSIHKGRRYTLAPERNTVLYVAPQAIYTYTLGKSDAVLVSGSKLRGDETYRSGEGSLGIIVNPVETHTTKSITISIFDSSQKTEEGANTFLRSKTFLF